MQALANFIHDVPERTPTLIKAALAHVQFETIHPFLHGNGRLGRLLITLILCHENALREHLLYLSLYCDYSVRVNATASVGLCRTVCNPTPILS